MDSPKFCAIFIILTTVFVLSWTSSVIIVEDAKACFRRVLAGKRITRALVRKEVLCERVEDCQRECSDEQRFACEGFNYRLDPTGHGQGICELIDLPLSRLDIRRDVYDDSEYDYYERDRNSNAPDCKGNRFYGTYKEDEDNYQLDNRYNYYEDNRRKDYYDDNRRRDYYDDYNRDSYDYGYRQTSGYGNYDWYEGGNRRGGKNYNYDDEFKSRNQENHFFDKNDQYYDKHKLKPLDDDNYKSIYPSRPYDYKSYEPYLPLDYWSHREKYHQNKHYYESHQKWDKYFNERNNDRNYWGFNNDRQDGWGSYGGAYGNFGAPDSYYSHNDYEDRNRNNNKHFTSYDTKYFYIPYEQPENSKDWGNYGGTYGYGNSYKYGDYKHFHDNHKESYDYWGLNNIYGNNHEAKYYYPAKPINPNPPSYNNIQQNNYEHRNYDYNDKQSIYGTILKDECSLRMVTGFRLHKGIIKKITSVSSIYECELLCYKEREFQCNSYAFRYSFTNNMHIENCYLSDRDYKELDYYTDLEPDRDCDVYRMHNQQRCEKPEDDHRRDSSECFWKVRSGQRLDHVVVRDSLLVNSIVECQLECLKSTRFTCRAFSFRYGSSIYGGAIDNCQLADRSYLDLNPTLHFVYDVGFEIYERGSYGHGCEPNHFLIGMKPTTLGAEDKISQICYVGYVKPAKLLPQATKKTVRVNTEEECKIECTQARQNSIFQCMSLSFRALAPDGIPNCDLSDIVQRDLLSNVDYVHDPNSWLFAWDIHNPHCSYNGIGLTGNSNDNIHSGIHEDHGKEIIPWNDPHYPLDTWKVYSVGGLPCKRGSLCRENKVAGFWFCELEGREEHAWDYCCRPDHQCGYSEGFPYQWCYVGPEKTQWRQCSDQYYPYFNDRFDYSHTKPNQIDHNYSGNQPWASTNTISSIHVPNKPDNSFPRPSNQPTLTNYEANPNQQFLDPPKPGGFGLPRHWPISFLHKELPPNNTGSDTRLNYRNVPLNSTESLNTIIKSNDPQDDKFNNSKYFHKSDEILHVKIPLNTNFNLDNRLQSIRSVDTQNINKHTEVQHNDTSSTHPSKDSPAYSRSHITKTDRPLVNTRQAKINKGFIESVSKP